MIRYPEANVSGYFICMYPESFQRCSSVDDWVDKMSSLYFIFDLEMTV